MENSKNDGLNEKTKNKKHSHNISSEKSNEDQADKKEDNLKEIPEESGTDNQKISEENETIREEKLLNEVTILKEEKLRLLAEMENLRKRFEREKIDLIKPLDHQEEGFTGKITEEVKNKFYKKQEERVKKEEAKQPTPPNEQKKE